MRLEETVCDWGETTETMGTRGYAEDERERGVRDWGRKRVTGETTETMGTRGCVEEGERRVGDWERVCSL